MLSRRSVALALSSVACATATVVPSVRTGSVCARRRCLRTRRGRLAAPSAPLLSSALRPPSATAAAAGWEAGDGPGDTSAGRWCVGPANPCARRERRARGGGAKTLEIALVLKCGGRDVLRNVRWRRGCVCPGCGAPLLLTGCAWACWAAPCVAVGRRRGALQHSPRPRRSPCARSSRRATLPSSTRSRKAPPPKPQTLSPEPSCCAWCTFARQLCRRASHSLTRLHVQPPGCRRGGGQWRAGILNSKLNPKPYSRSDVAVV